MKIYKTEEESLMDDNRDRYIIISISLSKTDLFEFTVIDTKGGPISLCRETHWDNPVLECYDMSTAVICCNALNKATIDCIETKT